MNAQPRDLQPILARIEMLERQNRRLKQVAAGWFLLLAVALLSAALSAGGQQETKERGTVARQKAPAQPSYWRLADGRLVVFPRSIKKVEEVDATALDLPPGTKVIGWEPVEGADSLLPQYAERIATVPTVKGKLDALANAAGILQAQVNVLREIEKIHSDYASERILHYARVLDDHATRINQALAVAADADTEIRMHLSGDTRNLKQELDDFKDAACPALRSLRASGMKLDYACGLH